MTSTRVPYVVVVLLGVVIGLVLSPPELDVRAQTGNGVSIDPDDLAGTVTGAKGPEAGVWVIAETTDLPTKFTRIVVTDDRGRYLVPDLPKATYNIWVRGYGLVDSPKVQSAPGKVLDLRAVQAPDARAAAAVLSCRVLAVVDSRAGQERVPRHWAERQRHFADNDLTTRLDPNAEVGRLHGVPPAWDARHAQRCRPRSARSRRRRRRGSAGFNPDRPAATW